MAQGPETLPNGRMMHQDDRFFKLGQDSVLLSAFARPRAGDRLLDLACGTGALLLLLSHRAGTLTGLELDADALALLRRSLSDNGIDAETICGDLRQIRSLLPSGAFDYVVCNPPYFASDAGKTSDTLPQARQDCTCTVQDVAAALAYCLHDGGKCALCFRPERLCVLLEALLRVRLAPKRLRFVQQTAASAPSIVLVECHKGGSAEGLLVEPPLLVDSEEVRRIYGK